MEKSKKKKKFRKFIILVMVLSTITGFVAGVLGELILDQYILPRQENQQRSLADLSRKLEEMTQSKEKTLNDILTEKDLEFNQAINSALPSVMEIYEKKSEAGDDIINQIYLSTEKRGHGFLFTSDGWSISTRQVVNTVDPRDFAVFVGGKEAAIEKILFDPSTDLVYFKVKAENLSVMGFGELELMAEGQSVMLLGKERVLKTSLNALDYYPREKVDDYVFSSEKYRRYLLIADSVSDDFLGSPLINNDGEIVGVLVSQRGFVIPIDFVKPIVKKLFDEGRVIRNYSGLHYIDLAETNLENRPEKGAFLFTWQDDSAVKKGAPGDDAGLREGDIVLKVNQDDVDKKNGLAELLQDYPSGSEPELTVLRDGQEIKLSLKLGEYK